MKKIVSQWMLTGALWCLLGVYLPAAEFYAELDKTQGSIEHAFYLTFIIKDASNVTRPDFPSTPEFDAQYQGQSSRTQIVNGNMSSQIEFRYSLLPRKTGQLTIPAVSVILDGQEYQTQPIHIEVVDAAAIPPEQKPAFVQQHLSVQHAYPHQQVLYTFELYLREGLHVTNLRFERPDFSAFQVKEVDNQEAITTRIGGQLYELYRVHLVLYPHSVGILEIPPATLHGQQIVTSSGNDKISSLLKDHFSSMLDKRAFQLRTSPMTLEVLPIPTKNRPESFYGLVGTYEIEATLSHQEVKVGESTTLSIKISGTGPVGSVRQPPLAFDPSIKTYEDQPGFEDRFHESQQINTTNFSVALVPSQSGEYTSPPIPITFFNPNTQSFETREAQLPVLTVIPGETQTLTTVGGEESQARKVKRLGEDLLPIHQDVAALRDASLSTTAGFTYAFLFLLGPFCFGMGWLWKWKIEHSAANLDKIRSNQAQAKFQKKLKQLYADIPENQPFAEALAGILKSYIGDKANKFGEALTAQEASLWLKEKHVDADTIHQWSQLLEQCEMAKYAANSLSKEGKDTLGQAGEALVRRLEEQLK